MEDSLDIIRFRDSAHNGESAFSIAFKGFLSKMCAIEDDILVVHSSSFGIGRDLVEESESNLIDGGFVRLVDETNLKASPYPRRLLWHSCTRSN